MGMTGLALCLMEDLRSSQSILSRRRSLYLGRYRLHGMQDVPRALHGPALKCHRPKIVHPPLQLLYMCSHYTHRQSMLVGWISWVRNTTARFGYNRCNNLLGLSVHALVVTRLSLFLVTSP